MYNLYEEKLIKLLKDESPYWSSRVKGHLQLGVSSIEALTDGVSQCCERWRI